MEAPFWRLTVPGQGSTIEFGFVWNCRDIISLGELFEGGRITNGQEFLF